MSGDQVRGRSVQRRERQPHDRPTDITLYLHTYTLWKGGGGGG